MLVIYYASFNLLLEPNVWVLLLGLILALALPAVIGRMMGGRLRKAAMSVSMLVGFTGAALTVIDTCSAPGRDS